MEEFVEDHEGEDQDELDPLNIEENEEYDFNMYFPPSVNIGDDEN